ncbi:MAG TPA: hypothetical protein VID93_00745 [Acidimicrobiales bacterium]
MRRAAIPASLLAAWAAMAAPVAGAVAWTLVGGPLTATVFQSTTYTFTATNLTYINDIGCVAIQLPASYTIDSLGAPVMSEGRPWSAEPYSGGGNWVEVSSDTGGGRLDPLEWVTFSLTATATQAGAFTWNHHAHRREDCTGADIEPGTMPMVVIPVAPTPTPVPSVPAPTPTPLPVPVPTLPPPPIGTPDPDPTVTPSPTSTARPTPSPTPRPTPEIIGAVPAAPPSQPGTPAVGRMAPLEDGQTSPIGLGTEVFALLEGPLVWFVPGAVVGGPGLLIVLFLALQAGGALAWIPAVRKMSGDPIPAQRRRRPGS